MPLYPAAASEAPVAKPERSGSWANGENPIKASISDAVDEDAREVPAKTSAAVGTWTFDSHVARRFAREAACHIPDYESVIEASVGAIELSWVPGTGPPGATGLPGASACARFKHSLAVLEVGCAIGYTMQVLLRRGFTHVFGVDSSADMLDACAHNLRSAGYDSEATLHLTCDSHMPQPSFFRGVPLGAVIANWTLHFIADPALRADYLRSIHEALVPGGCLILTDKTQQSAAVRSMYHAWKQKEPRNLSAEEVSAKELSLVGVLEPLPFQW